MPPNENSATPIQEFYQDATILITGGTGFLGKLLVEKLLRSCPNISQIILLIRGKKEANCEERLDHIMEETVLKSVSPKDRLKISAVSGDCSLLSLGLSEGDRQALLKSVNIVFHVAATVRFDEDLATAVAINIVGTQAMLDLARNMNNIKAFVHVSTAYSQCHMQEIQEKFYSPHYSPEKLIQLTQCVDKPYLDQITPILLDGLPNTYIYTKSIAEDLVRTHSKGLPVAVVRPSIVVATRDEPFPGWIDNLYGPTGVVVATTTGIMRTLYCNPDMVADIVPADMVVNGLIVTAWKTNINSTMIEQVKSNPEVFNIVSSPEKPITWGDFFNLGMKYRVPTIHAMWHPALNLNRSYLVHRFQHFLYHIIPAFVIDNAARLVGYRTSLLKITRKVDRFSELVSYFSTRQWKFSNNNVQDMWETLSPADKELFPFTFKTLNWETYFKTYIKGTRQYLLKEDITTVSKAMAKDNRLYWLHQILKIIMLYIVTKIFWWLTGAQCIRMVHLIFSRAQSRR